MNHNYVYIIIGLIVVLLPFLAKVYKHRKYASGKSSVSFHMALDYFGLKSPFYYVEEDLEKLYSSLIERKLTNKAKCKKFYKYLITYLPVEELINALKNEENVSRWYSYFDEFTHRFYQHYSLQGKPYVLYTSSEYEKYYRDLFLWLKVVKSEDERRALKELFTLMKDLDPRFCGEKLMTMPVISFKQNNMEIKKSTAKKSSGKKLSAKKDRRVKVNEERKLNELTSGAPSVEAGERPECSVCNSSFASEANLNKHYASKRHKENKKRNLKKSGNNNYSDKNEHTVFTTCSKCQKDLKSRKNLIMHIKEAHPEKENK